MMGRMLDQWMAMRRRALPPVRAPLPMLGAARVLDAEEARERPLGLAKLHVPPPHISAAQSTPEALLSRAMTRQEIAWQDRRAGDIATAQANEQVARDLLRQAMEH